MLANKGDDWGVFSAIFFGGGVIGAVVTGVIAEVEMDSLRSGLNACEQRVLTTRARLADRVAADFMAVQGIAPGACSGEGDLRCTGIAIDTAGHPSPVLFSCTPEGCEFGNKDKTVK